MRILHFFTFIDYSRPTPINIHISLFNLFSQKVGPLPVSHQATFLKGLVLLKGGKQIVVIIKYAVVPIE